MAAAIAAAHAGAEVCLLEARPTAGRSIMASGNGRCNFANTHLAPEHYNAPDFVAKTMGADPLERILSFFEKLGLWWCADEEGRLFPRSRAAASVLDILQEGLAEEGVDLWLDSRVTQVKRADSGWELTLDTGEHLRCDALIWAAGGGSAETIAAGSELAVVPEHPALCPLATLPRPAQELDGARVQCTLELRQDGTAVERQMGEVLFRPYGLSGIAVFDLSRIARPGDTLVLDLVPEQTEAELTELLERRADEQADRLCSPHDRLAFLDGAVHPKVASVLMWHVCGRDGADPVDPAAVAHLLKNWVFTVSGTADEEHAQIMQGGLAREGFDPVSLQASAYPSLFACGEALDIDGACGGYNLAWAWLSGLTAGSSAAAYLADLSGLRSAQ